MDSSALDDRSLIPDANGIIDISNGAWVNLDEEIWTHSKSLLVLLVENNSLEGLSHGLGNLHLLRELNVARNRIRSLPVEICQLSQLKNLNISHNMIESIPTEIQWCVNLQQLYASNNRLRSLPRQLRKCAELRILDVENNQLEQLPDTLCECLKLETLACEGNECLAQIPKELRSNTKLVLWICEKTKDHNEQLEEIQEINETLETMARVADEEKLRLKDEIMRLETIRQQLERERPHLYLKIKSKITSCCRIS